MHWLSKVPRDGESIKRSFEIKQSTTLLPTYGFSREHSTVTLLRVKTEISFPTSIVGTIARASWLL
jgi:hypothetical protein